MTSTGLLSKNEMQEKVVAELRRSIEVPGKVLMVVSKQAKRTHPHARTDRTL